MDLIFTADNPPPAGARAVLVHSTQGCELRAMLAGPKASARGTVLLVGGRGDYFERYFETMRDLVRRGYAVASFDFRGQGGSVRVTRNPLRSHITRFEDYDDDLEAVMSQLVMPHCPQPVSVIGHSTGACIVLRSLANYAWFRKATLLAPLIDLTYGGWPRPLVALLVPLFCGIGLSRMTLFGQRRRPLGAADFPRNPLTSDPRRWRRDSAILEAAPELGVGGATFGWLRAARRAIRAFAAMDHRTRLTAPALIVAAGAERVVSNLAMAQFAARVPGVARVEIPGALHEILGERDEYRDQFWAVFDSFMSDDEGVPEAASRASESTR